MGTPWVCVDQNRGWPTSGKSCIIELLPHLAFKSCPDIKGITLCFPVHQVFPVLVSVFFVFFFFLAPMSRRRKSLFIGPVPFGSAITRLSPSPYMMKLPKRSKQKKKQNKRFQLLASKKCFSLWLGLNALPPSTWMKNKNDQSIKNAMQSYGDLAQIILLVHETSV